MAGENGARRERLFNDFSQRLTQIRAGIVDTFICPFCEQAFTRADLAGDKLTLAHVLPDALGGSFCTLACAACNNNMGRDVEAYLIEHYRAEDAMQGTGKLAGRMHGPFGNVGVEVETSPDGPWTLIVIDKQTNPAVLEALAKALSAPPASGNAQVAASIELRYRKNPSRVSAALYQSAYLLMFAYFGYEFMFDPRFEKLREQIRKPDEAILPGSFDVPPDDWADNTLKPYPHGVLLVKQPSAFIMPVFRLRPDQGRSRVVGVPLPGLDDANWPSLGPRGHVKAVVVRFRPENDNGRRLGLREAWERPQLMP
jgi:hypothetical protein